MTTIDHRILIPAAPDVVWDFVSDITHNPDWQVDCTDVIFLTSRREGPGLRWRYATPGGHEMVVAVTAWYNGLGYEYYFVDGTAFRENKGRIRLQEIPEGTIVQWTFTYDLGGLLGGMRDSLGMKRQVDQTISESLKTLWQKIKQSSGASRTLEPKSLMRDAPDVEARSAYQPRHPSVVDMLEEDQPLRLAPTRLKLEPPISDDDAQPIRIFEEPPVVEDDTRPRSPFAPPAARKAEPAPELEADFEPDFLSEMDDFENAPFEMTPDIEPDFLDELEADVFDRSPVEPSFESPHDLSDTQPRQADVFAKRAEPAEATESLVDIRHLGEETEPLPVEQTTERLVDMGEETQINLDHEPEIDAEDTPTQAVSGSPQAPDPTATPANASIWEIFGVQRPSDTQEIAQVETASAEPETADAAEMVEAEAETVIDAEVMSEAEPEAVEPVMAASYEAKPALAAVSATQELPPVPTRIGLRAVQRRKLIRLRRP